MIGPLIASQTARKRLRVIGTTFSPLSASSTVTVNYPSGTLPGDLLVLFQTDTVGGPGGTPSGWTNKVAWNTWDATNSYRSQVDYRIAGAETSVVLSLNNNFHADLIVFRGNGGGVPQIGAAGAFTAALSGTINVGGLTPQDAWSVVTLWGNDRDPTVPGLPTGFTSQGTNTSAFWGNRLSTKEFNSIAATGTVAMTQADTTPFTAVGILIEAKP